MSHDANECPKIVKPEPKDEGDEDNDDDEDFPSDFHGDNTSSGGPELFEPNGTSN